MLFINIYNYVINIIVSVLTANSIKYEAGLYYKTNTERRDNLANKTVNPTRMELTRLKRKLKTAVRGHKLLKDKRDELMKQFLDMVRINKALRETVEEKIKKSNKQFALASAAMSKEILDAALMAPKQEVFLDVKSKKWSSEMIEICGISENMLPKLFESFEVVGDIKPELAKELGLNDDIKIIAGAGDNAAAAIGTATVGEGACNISLGTSGTIFISSRKFGVDKYNALHSFAHSDGKYHLMGCMLSAASCNKWWMEDILKTKDFSKEQENIDNLGENKVFFLPYLMGERSPHNDPAARGTFIGMSMDTRREDMTLAILEGVTFALRDSLEVARSLGIEIKKTMICGGGAKSALWKKLVANIMNVEVEVPVSEEGPGFGAAILAAVGCNEYESVEAATKSIIKIKERIQPEPELVAKYEKKYQKFRKIYPALKGIFKEIL